MPVSAEFETSRYILLLAPRCHKLSVQLMPEYLEVSVVTTPDAVLLDIE